MVDPILPDQDWQFGKALRSLAESIMQHFAIPTHLIGTHMDETEWLASADPRPMLRHLSRAQQICSTRKQTLWVEACDYFRADDPANARPGWADLLRDIFGNPFRVAPLGWWQGQLTRFIGSRDEPNRRWGLGEIESTTHLFEVVPWLTWRGGTVRKLAEHIYEARDWSAMPILGDDLEESGCTDEAILGHLRGPAPHVRGCWVVDMLLGKD